MEIAEAQYIVLSHTAAGPAVRLPLRESLFRTLAEPISCDGDFPPFDRSLMDGYAVRSTDVSGAPCQLRCLGQIAAGAVPERSIGLGETIQVNTGAPIPPGSDAVVRVEDTVVNPASGQIQVRKMAAAGQFITRRGAFAKAGEVVIARGVRLTPLELAVAAAVGADFVEVHRQPTVAILSTGDELVDTLQSPQGAQIRNSNGCLLEALVRTAFAEPVDLGISSDDPQVIRAKIMAGLASNVLCITGGVSMGAFDFVPRVLTECGAALRVQKIAIKPGRPTIFATAPQGTLIFALPGNPVSAFVGFELLVRPALAALEGRSGRIPRPIRATLIGQLTATLERTSYWPARVEITEEGHWLAQALTWRGSGDPFGMSEAKALIVQPPQSSPLQDGAAVSALLLDRIG